MGKYPPMYTDTETDNTSSSVENLKKKKKSSILKYTSSVKKKKCKIHSRSEHEDSDFTIRGESRSESRSGKKKLQGILKHDRDRDRERERERDRERERERERERQREREKDRYYSSSAEDEDERYEPKVPVRQDPRCLVGRVPHPAGSKPGRGGGVALIVKKNLKNAESLQTKPNVSSTSKKNTKRLAKKRSY